MVVGTLEMVVKKGFLNVCAIDLPIYMHKDICNHHFWQARSNISLFIINTTVYGCNERRYKE
jgi:hypothetical protein